MADALLFSLFAFIFVGPLFFAIFGGLVIHKLHKIPVSRALAAMIAPYILFVGAYAVSLRHSPDWGYSTFGADPMIWNLRATLLALASFWLVALFAFLVPFCHRVFPAGERVWRRTLKTAAIVAASSYALMALAFLPAMNISILRAEQTSEWAGVLPAEKISLYYIYENEVRQMDLTSGQWRELKKLEFKDGDLFFVPKGKGKGDVVVTNPRGAELVVEQVEHSDKLILSDRGDQMTLVGYLPTAELYVPPMLTLNTPLIRWFNGRDNMFPTGEIVFELGKRIYFYSPQTRKLLYVHPGRSPLLIVKN